MNTLGHAISLAWTLAAWFLMASIIAAPVVALIQKARARGKRKFVTEPTARVKALHAIADHRQDIQ